METTLTQFLTPKQKRFCDEYLTDHNATLAALRAGYSRDTAMNGYLMTLPKIKAYLDQQSEFIAQEAQVTHAQVLRELCKIAFGNMSNYFAADGRMKPMNALTEDDKAALWNMSVSDGEDGPVTKIKMYNKLAALEKIAKHINFYGTLSDEPKVVYKYVTTGDVTADDTFDDPALQKEIMDLEIQNADKEAFEKWELTKKGLEACEELPVTIPTTYNDDLSAKVGETEKPEDMGEDGLKEEVENTQEYPRMEKNMTVETCADLIKVDSFDLNVDATGLVANLNVVTEQHVEVLTTDMTIRPNINPSGLSGRLISPEERAERRKQTQYWMSRNL